MVNHLKSHAIDSDEDLNNENDEEMELMGEEIVQKAADNHKKRVEKTHSALLVMLISCAFAFNVVSNPKFVSFVQMLNPTYEVPSPYVLSHSYLDKEFMLVVSNIRKELEGITSASVTLDPWTFFLKSILISSFFLKSISKRLKKDN
jgi:hypothetical protein